MQYSEEPLTRALEEEITVFLEKHYQEIEHYKDLRVKPAWETYQMLHQGGVLKIYTARDHGLLKGYVVHTLNPSLHYQGITQAQQDLMYVDPSVRGKGIGTRLIKFADAQLTKLGIHSVYQHVHLVHDFSKILERQGYRQIEKVFTKRL